MRSQRTAAPTIATLLCVLMLFACATSKTPPVGAGPPDPNGTSDPAAQSAVQAPGITVAQRVQSALEGFVMGAVLGAQAGPIGAAIGAGTMLIYAAATGHVPFGGPRRNSAGGFGSGGYPGGSEAEREAAIEAELEQQVARADHLEDEIEAELRRQEELLAAIDEAQEVPEPAAIGPAPEPAPLDAGQADVRVAPTAPTERKLPLAIFEKEHTTIQEDAWGNEDEIEVIKRSLDADRDDNPEQIRYYGKESGELLRVEHDSDYDGEMDTWTNYDDGQIVERVVDSNSDSKPDTWERYEENRLTERVVDRNNDGVRDAFYTYEGGSLVEERHDANNDGTVDLIFSYEERRRVRSERDADLDGTLDTWTKYRVVNGEEIVSEVRRDTEDEDTKPDVIETFSAKDGKAILSRREEDVDGDGEVDITSIYENGKLQKREISDPSLVPM